MAAPLSARSRTPVRVRFRNAEIPTVSAAASTTVMTLASVMTAPAIVTTPPENGDGKSCGCSAPKIRAPSEISPTRKATMTAAFVDGLDSANHVAMTRPASAVTAAPQATPTIRAGANAQPCSVSTVVVNAPKAASAAPAKLTTATTR